ncbi:hypothetical protein BIFDEN_01940 [Bifidobacterium dentium ATCC 27678]|nr:hypothetical protein BIFDEN_01940 [Bifidobacterium dentium ATCC 27678]
MPADHNGKDYWELASTLLDKLVSPRNNPAIRLGISFYPS